MTQPSVSFENLRTLISTQLKIPVERIVPESTFLDDLGADSLDIIELGMAMEEAYAVALKPEDYKRLGTVGEALAYVREQSVSSRT